MKWKFWARPDRYEKKSSGLSLDKIQAKWGPLLELGVLANGSITARTATGALAAYRQSSAVSAPVRMIATDIALLNPIIETDGDVDPNPAALELVSLLNNPGENWLKDLFFETLSIYQSVTGNAYIWAGGNINRPPLAIGPVNPADITIDHDGSGTIISISVNMGPYRGVYKAETKNGRTRYIANGFAEITQIRGFSSRTGGIIEGESPLVSVGAEIEQMVRGNTHNNSLLANGGRMSALFSLKGDITDEQFEAARAEIFLRYKGEAKAGTIAVVGAEDVSVSEFGVSPKDMDFAKMLVLARSAVALQYGVPPVLITQEKATFSNMDTAREMLFDNAVSPSSRRLFSGIEAFLFPRFGLDVGRSSLTFDQLAVPSLRARRIRELNERRKANVETLNELRASINREPIDGGDEVFVPATMIPLSMVDDDDEPVVMPQPDDDEDDEDDEDDG
ncbi:MAG: phage portal protein [Gammaproteobacteria bacterium]